MAPIPLRLSAGGSSAPEGEVLPATPQAKVWKRPWGLPFFIALWCAFAVYDAYLSFTLYGPQDSTTLYIGAGSNYSLVVQDLTLRLFLQVISIVQLLIIYGLWKGSAWGYLAGLAASASVFLTYVSLFLVYYLAPVRIGLRTLPLYENLLLILAFTGLTWLYLTRPKVKAYMTRWA